MIDFDATSNEFFNVDSNVCNSIDDEIKNCFAIDKIFMKKFLTIDEFVRINEFVTIDDNALDLINFTILTQRLLIRYVFFNFDLNSSNIFINVT